MKPSTFVATVLLVTGMVASAPAIAQTEFPITSIVYIGQDGNAQTANFTVPDTDTTRSAYGGRLRRYDVHVAKMFELTNFECENTPDRTWSRILWSYKAGGGQIDMGMFDISCDRAAGAGHAYGFGKPEATKVYYYRVPATVYVPILNITDWKVSAWMNYTKNFRPEFGD